MAQPAISDELSSLIHPPTVTPDARFAFNRCAAGCPPGDRLQDSVWVENRSLTVAAPVRAART